jgi:hypothetical protein
MKIRMLETTFFEGNHYKRDEEYDVDESTAFALGPSAKILEAAKKGKKAAKKMVESAKNTAMTGVETGIENK